MTDSHPPIDGRWRLHEVVGQNRRITVYRATDEKRGHAVLVTVFGLDPLLPEQERGRIRDEAQKIALTLVPPAIALSARDPNTPVERWQAVRPERWKRIRSSDTTGCGWGLEGDVGYVAWCVWPGLGRLASAMRRPREFPDTLRQALLQAAGGRCQVCGAVERLEVDHIVPVALGGTAAFDNGQVLCAECHRTKQAIDREIRVESESEAKPHRPNSVTGPHYVTGAGATRFGPFHTQEKAQDFVKKYVAEELRFWFLQFPEWQEYQAFRQRRLDDLAVEYLFCHGLDEPLRRTGRATEALLCLWAICADGRKVMLDLLMGNREPMEGWLDCLRGLVARGLRPPVLMTSDGAPGLIAALEQVFPKALRQRCLAHETRNVLAKVSAQDHARVKADIQSAYYASSLEAARLLARQVVERWQSTYPSAMASFLEDFEACIASLRCPADHHKYIRTANLPERSIQEERRRAEVIRMFPDKKIALKSCFALLWRASQRWQRVRMTDWDRLRLERLRQVQAVPKESGTVPSATSRERQRQPFTGG